MFDTLYLYFVPSKHIAACVTYMSNNSFHDELRRQAVSEESKKMYALSAALRRLCCPKPSSGKLEVSSEIYKQWKQGGTQRKALLDVFTNAGGDKDFFFGKSRCMCCKAYII